jgi:hypothetical protein
MIKLTLPTFLKDSILHEAIRRDIGTAWGVPSLEHPAWQDSFYRDMRVVKCTSGCMFLFAL